MVFSEKLGYKEVNSMNSIRLASWMVIGTVISSFFLCPMNVALAQTAALSNNSAAAVKPVSINKANPEELQAVRGIGPALAERIVNYRQANGGFKSLEQLKEVKGIGDGKFEKMRDQITL